MAINDWWAGHSEQRFWMEITDRDDVGADLRAPQANASGKEEWSYALVTYTQPGDVVFHWHKSSAGQPAIVGWSRVEGPLYADSDEWLAHGTRGRLRGRPERVPYWVMPLTDYRAFATPITKSVLDLHRDDVLAATRDVQGLAGGSAYPPFYLYGGSQLRAMQSYLTKFPAALVGLLEELSGARLIAQPTGPGSAASRRRGGGGQGWQQDAQLRLAVEQYAVDRAIAHYKALGSEDPEVLGKPYDLKVRLDGVERHVEVKGTTSNPADKVLLTVNEVTHANAWAHTDLFVVYGIQVERDGEQIALSGGADRKWMNWNPDTAGLHPTQFAYELPGGPEPDGSGPPLPAPRSHRRRSQRRS